MTTFMGHHLPESALKTLFELLHADHVGAQFPVSRVDIIGAVRLMHRLAATFRQRYPLTLPEQALIRRDVGRVRGRVYDAAKQQRHLLAMGLGAWYQIQQRPLDSVKRMGQSAQYRLGRKHVNGQQNGKS